MELENKVLVIIPAFNEEGSVGKVVEGVKTFLPEADILVVNDGSMDRTSEKAKESGAVVLDLPFNLGIGGAMQAGYKYALEKDFDIAIQVDGDGQHDPKEIPKLLKMLEEKNVDMVIGSRFIGDSEFKSSVMRREVAPNSVAIPTRLRPPPVIQQKFAWRFRRRAFRFLDWRKFRTLLSFSLISFLSDMISP